MNIIIEGPDGCGKTTQVQLLQQSLGLVNDTVCYREPGGTALGEKMRNILLDPNTGSIDSLTEVMMFTASRIELYKLVKEEIDQGKIVLFDRSYISTYVYQLEVGGIAKPIADAFKTLMDEIIKTYIPNKLLIYISVSEDILNQRRKLRQDNDRFENKPVEYHKMVYDAYNSLKYDHIIDGNKSIQEIHQNIKQFIQHKWKINH